jgi:flavin-dependent dehydrogenase
MACSNASFDAVVIGEHPSASLASSLLARRGRDVLHLSRRHAKPLHRLALLSPSFFSLDKSLSPLRRKLKLSPLHGMTLLGERADLRGQHLTPAAAAFVVETDDFSSALQAHARTAGAATRACHFASVVAVDESGVRLVVDGKPLLARLLMLADELDETSAKLLGMPARWPAALERRLTFLGFRAPSSQPSRRTLVVSMDLVGTSQWAWLLCGKTSWQAAVESPAADDSARGVELLARWLDLLRLHGLISDAKLDVRHAQSVVLPFEGAMERDCVASRTLLLGPAGGFICGSGEELLPCCWSAVFAAQCADEALDHPPVQDTLRRYREAWGSTLGDYLRGPRNNLRYLLPLAFRNPVMTRRLAEAVLLGQSVVR